MSLPSLPQTLLVCFLAMALVSAIPIDETVAADAYEASEIYNPQDPQEFFKLKKLKKLLLLG